MSDAQRGLSVNIYDNPGGNYSSNGISARYNDAVIIGDGIPAITPVAPDVPAVRLVVRRLFQGTPGERVHVHAEPVERGMGAGPMFGGAFIHTSDSRFGEIVRQLAGDGRTQVGPIPLHDRFETTDFGGN